MRKLRTDENLTLSQRSSTPSRGRDTRRITY